VAVLATLSSLYPKTLIKLLEFAMLSRKLFMSVFLIGLFHESTRLLVVDLVAVAVVVHLPKPRNKLPHQHQEVLQAVA
jgi:hypothetical protein